MNSFSVWLLGAALLAGAAQAQPTSALLRPDAQGHLTYVPDSRGNVVPDFSAVGYRSGDVPIPTVPVVLTLSPVAGDNRAQIQAALDVVAARPVQANGFRGAVLLRAGTYPVGGSLVLRASGVVLRGQGAGPGGTVLQATLRQQYTLVQVAGAGGPATQGSGKRLTASYVPIGATTVAVAANHGFAVGDRVMLRRDPNQAWINMLGMNLLTASCPTCTNWTPSSYTIDFMRRVQAVTATSVTLDAPVVDPIDQTYAAGFLLPYTWNGRVENVGIEDLRLDSDYSGPDDENHAWDAIGFENAEHGWVRNVEAYHFGYAAVHVRASAAHISILNSKCLDPISLTQGERKYSFAIEGQRNLIMGCLTRGGRHDFMTNARVAGPNAFVRCTAMQQLNISGPHARWATGTLYDNFVGDGPLNVENRLVSGTGHGWAGAQNMLWNAQTASIVVQSPPQHVNWAVGCRAIVSGTGSFSSGQGYVESTGTFVTPRSLYDQQLCDRLGGAACTVLDTATPQPAARLLVYPNPSAKRIVTVYFPGTKGQLLLLDTLGRTVLEQPDFVPGPLHLGRLADGTYTLRVATAHGAMLSTKLVKE